MRVKSCPVSVKVAETDDDDDTAEKGIFEAYVATWDLDSVGDRIVKGAFADNLKEWAAAAKDNRPMPVIWSHMHADPNAHVGWLLDAKEDDRGLWVKAQIDVDAPAPSHAAQVWRLLKGGRINQMSFAYDVLEGGYVDQKGEDGSDASYYELRKLKVFEIGPCLIGANQNTELLSAKTADGRELRLEIGGVSAADSAAVKTAVRAALAEVGGAKAGRVLAAKHVDALTNAKTRLHDAIADVESVLSAAGDAGSDRAADRAAETTDEPAGSSGDEKDRSQPAPGSAEDSTATERKSDAAPTGSASATRHRLDFERMALELGLPLTV